MEDEEDYWCVDDVEDNNDVVHVDNVSVDDDDDVDADDILGDDESLKNVQLGEPVQESIAIDLTDDHGNPFISAYNHIIKHAKDNISGPWKDGVWEQKNLNIESPATTQDTCMARLIIDNTLPSPIK